MRKLHQKSSPSFKYFLLLSLLIPCITVAGTIINVPSPGIGTLTAAMVKARAGDTIVAENGVYKEHIFIKAGIVLKAKNMHKAKLDGKGKGTIVTMGSNSSIVGFIIQNGTIGIFTKNAGISILKCQVAKNWMTGIMSIRHLPRIEDNLIIYNRASGFQGWNVRSTVSSINHNTIAYNANHGIAVGGSSNIVVENNTIAYNERFALKFSSNSEKSKIVNNNFYKNLKTVHKMPAGNYDFNPAFISPRLGMNFKSDPKVCCQIKASDNENLGARLDY
jgi:parallel beta-helix repeat protein